MIVTPSCVRSVVMTAVEFLFWAYMVSFVVWLFLPKGRARVVGFCLLVALASSWIYVATHQGPCVTKVNGVCVEVHP